jgi:general secretion pathway protein F
VAAFEYAALNARGRQEKGLLEADSQRHVRQLLRDRGLVPLAVAPASRAQAGPASWRSWFAPSLGVRDLALLTRQLATMIAAALPVEEALLAVSQQSEKPRVAAMLLATRSRVLEGYSLARSLAEFPRAFPELYRATVAAGEAAGHLDLVLERLAEHTEARQASRARVQQALVYPVILLALTIAILAGLLGYVVPDIVKVFADTGQELPALTRALIAGSGFVQHWGLALAGCVLLLAVAARQALRRPRVRLRVDRRLLHLPLVGKLSRGFNAAQFASTLSILNSSGVPLVQSMEIAGQVLANSWLREKVREAAAAVSEGGSLHRGLARSGYFPPMMLHMIASGETSGELDDMLARASRFLQDEVDSLMAMLLSLFGPLMLLLMGGAVFAIVMAILLPIMNLNRLVG